MLSGYHIILVEDDDIMGASLVQRLKLEGADVVWHKQTSRALGAIRTPRVPIDAVICDIRLPDGTGEDLYTTLCKTTQPPPFLFITGHGGVEQAVRLIKAGAADYVTKPFEIAVFLERLAMLLSKRNRQELPPVLGISPAARRVDELALKAAESDRPVLVVGGPGTGKGLVARRIFEVSNRRAAPFVSVNFAREADIELALMNALESVGDGILFLNALSRITTPAQAVLLAALDKFSGRIIATCGQDHAQLLAEDNSRADFFYRLDMLEIPIPPLRSRPEDAIWLMQQLFPSPNAARSIPLMGISALCEGAVRSHDWPGGGRELRSRVQRAIENASGEYLQPVDLFPERVVQPDAVQTLAEARESVEKAMIIEALALTDGQIAKAAARLKVSRTTLWEKMQRLGIAAKQG